MGDPITHELDGATLVTIRRRQLVIVGDKFEVAKMVLLMEELQHFPACVPVHIDSECTFWLNKIILPLHVVLLWK